MTDATLLMRLCGPLQSWGVSGRFGVRDAGREPSKSGVIGLICACMGRPRSAPIGDLCALALGTRADNPGVEIDDFHTVGCAKDGAGVYPSDGTHGAAVLTTRFYLSGADFLVGLHGDADLLRRVEAALQDPVWAPHLGRRSCVPSVPVWVPGGLLIGVGLRDALVSHPWPRQGARVPPPERRPSALDLVLECGPSPDAQVRMDQPESTFADRLFGPRRVLCESVLLGSVVPFRVE